MNTNLNSPNCDSKARLVNLWIKTGLVCLSGFLVYMSVVLVLCAVLVLYLCPRLGPSNILVYISICSLLGAFTVSSVKGLAIAIHTGECQLSSRSHDLHLAHTHVQQAARC